jgi:hypothetical protein
MHMDLCMEGSAVNGVTRIGLLRHGVALPLLGVSGIRIVAVALLAAGVLLPVDDADAQPRQPPPQWTDPAGPPVEMEMKPWIAFFQRPTPDELVRRE